MIERLARLGYASKAFIYGVVGLLAAAAAFNRGGEITDTRGALRVILSHPFGNTILWVLAAGLCGYSLWRLLDSVFDPEGRGTSPKGLVNRIAAACRGLLYGGVGIEAFRLARGLRSSGASDTTVRSWTARILEWPLGEWLVVLLGAIIAAYGISEVVDAIRKDEDEKRHLPPMDPSARRSLNRICRFGVGSRAVIITVLGVFLVRAALQHDPGEARGVRGSILVLANAVEGRIVLAAIAFGLLAYAVDQAMHAKYRRIQSPLP